MKQSKTKTAVIVLSVLLAASVLSLAATLVYNHFSGTQPASVVVPENVITPQEDSSSAGEQNGSAEYSSAGGNTESGDMSAGTADFALSSNAGMGKTATALSLDRRNPGDNAPFNVNNMFPGDSETKYFCVRVSYQNIVTVHCRADVREGYEKLSEVLKTKVVLLSTGETLYDGLMRDMPEALVHTLPYTEQSKTAELYYEITAYLDTSVGNEYMERDLVADLRWWVPQTEYLTPPKTADSFHMAFWACMAAGSLFVLIFLCKKRRKGDEQREQ